jgi:hypothetical protein
VWLGEEVLRDAVVQVLSPQQFTLLQRPGA